MTATNGFALLGYAFMGKADSRAFNEVRLLAPPLQPELVSISGRNPAAVEEARAQYGWGRT